MDIIPIGVGALAGGSPRPTIMITGIIGNIAIIIVIAGANHVYTIGDHHLHRMTTRIRTSI